MKATLTRQHHLLAAVGHASRYRLFLLLAQRERCVTELAAEVGLSQSCTTRHVQALAAAGAVVAKRDGKRVRVRLRLERAEVAGLLTWCVGAGAAADAALATATEAADPVRRALAAAPRARAATAPTAANPRVVAASAPAAAISGTNVAPEPDHAAAPVAPRPRPDRRDLEDFLL